jgi:hypothetical protein
MFNSGGENVYSLRSTAIAMSVIGPERLKSMSAHMSASGVRVELAWLASPKLGRHGRRLGPADLYQRPIITNPGPSHLYNTIYDRFAGDGRVP